MPRQLEGGAEVVVNRLVGGEHLLEEAGLRLVLDVADGERADAEGIAARQRRAVHEQLHALDARRRHGVDVGDDEQVLGERLVLGADDVHAGGGSGEDHLGVGDDVALLFLGLARLAIEVDAEALLGDLGRLDDAIDAAMGDERAPARLRAQR